MVIIYFKGDPFLGTGIYINKKKMSENDELFHFIDHGKVVHDLSLAPYLSLA